MNIIGYAALHSVRESVQSAVAARTLHGRYDPRVGSSPRLGQPVAAYLWGYDSVLRGTGLDSALFTGLRFPILGGAECGLVLMTNNESSAGKEMMFGGILFGSMVRRFYEAAAFAESCVVDLDTIYEARLLEVPSIFSAALWLKSAESDRFVLLLDGLNAAKDELLIKEELISQVTDRVADREARARNAREDRFGEQHDSPTN